MGLAAGCGGGGGSPAASGAFSGTYYYALVDGTYLDAAGGADWGSFEGHGNGELTIELNWNDDGSVNEADPRPMRATVDASRRWTLLNADGSPTSWAGGLSSDGGVGTLSQVFEFSDPALGLIVRPTGPYDMTALAGSYHLVRWVWAPGAGELAAATGVGRLESTGLWTVSGVEQRNRVLVSWNAGGSWFVSPAGRTTFNVGLATHLGGMAAGGRIFVAGGGTAEGSDPALIAGVRRSSGMTAADFAGTYHVVLLGHNPAGTVTWWGTLSSAGAGTWTGAFSGKLDRGMLPDTDGEGTYTVAPTGTFTLSLGSGATLSGGLSEGGEFAVAAGPTNMDAGPQIWVLVRR